MYKDSMPQLNYVNPYIKILKLFLADNCAPGEFVNTPRSLQACLYLGIDPQEIENKYVFFTALCIYLSIYLCL
jgi:hypothetical protein